MAKESRNNLNEKNGKSEINHVYSKEYALFKTRSLCMMSCFIKHFLQIHVHNRDCCFRHFCLLYLSLICIGLTYKALLGLDTSNLLNLF
jgi:hypothetical protein